MCIFFVFGLTSLTKEQLESILEKKLEQKLAPIKKSFEELQKLVVFASSQYDDLLCRVTSCEKENSMLKDENKIPRSALGSLETSLKSLLTANNDQQQHSRKECVEINQPPCQRGGKSFGCWGYWQRYFCKSPSSPVKSLPEQETSRPVAYHC